MYWGSQIRFRIPLSFSVLQQEAEQKADSIF